MREKMFRFSAISAFTKARAGKKRNLQGHWQGHWDQVLKYHFFVNPCLIALLTVV